MQYPINTANTSSRCRLSNHCSLISTLLVAVLAMCSGAWAYPQQETEANQNVATTGEAVDYAAQALRVNLWLDKESDDVYRRGEQINVQFETNADAYAVIYRIDAEGSVEVLWPRSRFDDGFIFGRHPYSLPASGTRQIRAAGVEGVGYIEALVSLYPFDLRDLELDFHHEPTNTHHSFYAAGDPFLAMNEINFAITGLEDTADFVVTNYTSYYVHRQVEHPRYLCGQCHMDEDVAYEPYHDSCTIDIHFDYDWGNNWYTSYGYYPVYHYPVYYYVDPWSYSPWVNYWYRPWYRWPSVVHYDWDYHCYNWHHSPYYHGDSWHHYDNGNRRYRPLDKSTGARHAVRKDTGVNRRVPQKELSRDKYRAMKDRSALSKSDRQVRNTSQKDVRTSGKTRYSDVKSVERTRVVFRGETNVKKRGGLQIRDTRTGYSRKNSDRQSGKTIRNPRSGSSVRNTTGTTGKGSENRSTTGAGQVRDRSRTSDRKGSGDRGAIKPVETRKPGSRIWNGGRTAPSSDRKAKPQQVRPQKKSGDSRSGSSVDRSRSRKVQPRVAPRKKSSSGSNSSRSPKVKPTSKPKSSVGSSSRGSGSSSRKSSGGSKSGSSKSKSGGGSKKSSGGKGRR